jgi:HEAT repeat protein
MQQPTPPPAKPQAAKPKPAPPKPPVEFQEGEIATLDAAALVRILSNPQSSQFQRAKACQRAGEIGAKEAVPALAALLGDPQLGTYARYGLEPIADASAGDALRAALGKLKGDPLIGVINSLAKRRDAKSAPALVKMLSSPSPDLAAAAAAALGAIAAPATLKDLQAALARSSGAAQMALADACLVFADRLLEDGKRDQALALYAALTAPSVPKAARLGAMSGIIREETSLGRPR